MLKRYIRSTISFVVLAIPSIILILNLFKGPDPDGFLTNFCAQFFYEPGLVEFGVTYPFIAGNFFILLAWLNILLLTLTYVYIIILDTINISLHWLIKSGIFVGLIILINLFFLNSTAFVATQNITISGAYLITICSTIYYLVMFHLILIVKNWLNNKHVQR